jgi:hypothetical protein
MGDDVSRMDAQRSGDRVAVAREVAEGRES